MRHEFGHGMGLLHVLNFKDLLYPIVGPDTCKVIHYDDQQGGIYELANVAPYLDQGVCFTPNPRYQSLPVCTASTTGIAEIGNENSINAYPNPFDQTITIDAKLDGQSKVQIDLFDVLGQKIISNNYNSISDTHFQTTINTAGLSIGIYLVSVSINGRLDILKLMKN